MRTVAVLAGGFLCALVGAGQYVAQYDGGVADIVGPLGSEWSASYYLNPNTGYYGGSWVSADEWNPHFAGRPGSVSCHDEITVTFTWTGEKGEELPDYVVLEKLSLASWHGDSGSAANGLGDPEVVFLDWGSSSNLSPPESDYVVIANPGERITVTIEPSANAAVDASGGLAPAASAEVAVRIRALQLDLRFAGAQIVEDIWRLMIGQDLDAYIYSELSLDGATYDWGVTEGAGPFKEYIVTQEWATLNEQLDTDEPRLEVYFGKWSAFTATCQLTVPGVGTLSFSKPGSTEKPNASTDVTIGTLPLFEPDNVSPDLVRLGYIIPNSNPPAGLAGISWAGIINTPDPFDHSGSGEWALAQIARLYRRWDDYYMGILQPLMWYDIYTDDPINGVEGLDEAYPYANGPWWPADDEEAGSNDSPSQSVGETWVEVVDSFDTYYMYRPPSAPYGSGRTQVVSIKNLEWYWEAYANEDPASGQWVWTAQSAAWQYLEDFPTQPTWTWRLDFDNFQVGPG